MSFENFRAEDNKVALAMDLKNEKKNKIMRNLKFRAWDNINKKFIFSDWKYGALSFWEQICNDFNNQYEPPQEYTHSNDKNKVEIYEGDIVKMFDEDNRDEVCEVIFNNGGFVVEWDGNFAGGEADLTTIGWAIEEGIEVEVIGNIYQHPHLLK